MTPSPFDAYLAGNQEALPPAAKAGLEKFINTGCVACHNGVGVGGGMYQKFGVVEDYWKATGSDPIDKGRFDVTKEPNDLYVFRVASLRNVAMTPPYFHDGSVATLPEAVKVMARVQLGVTLERRRHARHRGVPRKPNRRAAGEFRHGRRFFRQAPLRRRNSGAGCPGRHSGPGDRRIRQKLC